MLTRTNLWRRFANSACPVCTHIHSFAFSNLRSSHCAEEPHSRTIVHQECTKSAVTMVVQSLLGTANRRKNKTAVTSSADRCQIATTTLPVRLHGFMALRV